ncbi:MAG: hypothetical protein KDE47_30455, partial [Caldilineaceae bacterium]|nr:hypothetical protein [Caldilineaceae bacterium]
SHHPHLLLAWIALQALGDEDDKALASAPIAAMDPDGEFVSSWFAMHYERPPTVLTVTATEAALLGSIVSVDS